MRFLVISFTFLISQFANADLSTNAVAHGSAEVGITYQGKKWNCAESKNWLGCAAFGVMTGGVGLLATVEEGQKTSLEKVETYAVLGSDDQNNLKAVVYLGSAKGCATSQGVFDAVEKSAGIYDLYAKSVEGPFGEMLVFSDRIVFNFPLGMILDSTGKGGHACTFRVDRNSYLSLIRRDNRH